MICIIEEISYKYKIVMLLKREHSVQFLPANLPVLPTECTETESKIIGSLYSLSGSSFKWLNTRKPLCFLVFVLVTLLMVYDSFGSMSEYHFRQWKIHEGLTHYFQWYRIFKTLVWIQLAFSVWKQLWQRITIRVV